MIVTIIAALVALVIGGAAGYFIFRYVIKGKYNEMIEAANKEAEVVKEKKLLEVKEKFLNKKAELEKEVQQRNSRIQQNENKLKQREISLNQRQEDLGRRKMEIDQYQQRVDNEKKLLSVKQQELDKMQKQEQAKLEELSGLSAEEAKQRLIESLKDQAKLDAASYVNEIMDDAKLNANQQAKKIVIQTIQRVATETAIENSVSVFHIDNDEVKGRIIGREGRNIRALEAATGVEIVVDDTPEAIVISAFDPVRRPIWQHICFCRHGLSISRLQPRVGLFAVWLKVYSLHTHSHYRCRCLYCRCFLCKRRRRHLRHICSSGEAWRYMGMLGSYVRPSLFLLFPWWCVIERAPRISCIRCLRRI